MRRIIITTLSLALLVGFASLSSGCASSGGTYFQKTRSHKPHAHRNRIYNPADHRYTTADDAPEAG